MCYYGNTASNTQSGPLYISDSPFNSTTATTSTPTTESTLTASATTDSTTASATTGYTPTAGSTTGGSGTSTGTASQTTEVASNSNPLCFNYTNAFTALVCIVVYCMVHRLKVDSYC